MKQRISNKEDWSNFSLGYLYLAQLGCQEIINNKFKDEDFHIKNIYIPILFNIKHAIEIFLKTFTIEFIRKESLENSDYSHNIQDLFLKFKEKVSKERLQKVIVGWENRNPKNKGKINCNSIFDELEKIISKYQSLDFLKEKIGVNYCIDDMSNTAFKYPTNDLNIKINYNKLSEQFTKKDAEESLEDILRLQNNFWKLHIILYIERGDN